MAASSMKASASIFHELPNNIIIDIINMEMKRRMNEHLKIHRGKMKKVAVDIRTIKRISGGNRDKAVDVGRPERRRLWWIFQGSSKCGKRRWRRGVFDYPDDIVRRR